MIDYTTCPECYSFMAYITDKEILCDCCDTITKL